MSPKADTPRSEPTESEPRGLGWIYWALGGLVLVLIVVGIATWSNRKDDQEAQDKAAALVVKFEQAGLPVPQDIDIVINSLGHDGGAVCDDPGDALRKASLHDMVTNGASFVGRRPIIVDRDLLKAEALILQTYCPEELDKYKDSTDDLKTDDVIKE